MSTMSLECSLTWYIEFSMLLTRLLGHTSTQQVLGGKRARAKCRSFCEILMATAIPDARQLAGRVTKDVSQVIISSQGLARSLARLSVSLERRCATSSQSFRSRFSATDAQFSRKTAAAPMVERPNPAASDAACAQYTGEMAQNCQRSTGWESSIVMLSKSDGTAVLSEQGSSAGAEETAGAGRRCNGPDGEASARSTGRAMLPRDAAQGDSSVEAEAVPPPVAREQLARTMAALDEAMACLTLCQHPINPSKGLLRDVATTSVAVCPSQNSPSRGNGKVAAENRLTVCPTAPGPSGGLVRDETQTSLPASQAPRHSAHAIPRMVSNRPSAVVATARRPALRDNTETGQVRQHTRMPVLSISHSHPKPYTSLASCADAKARWRRGKQRQRCRGQASGKCSGKQTARSEPPASSCLAASARANAIPAHMAAHATTMPRSPCPTQQGSSRDSRS